MGKAFESIKAGLVEAMAHGTRDPQGDDAAFVLANPQAASNSTAAASQKSPRIVACPKCGADVKWIAENRYRPFCSARCKGVDFVAWATDGYRIEATEEPHPEDTSE